MQRKATLELQGKVVYNIPQRKSKNGQVEDVHLMIMLHAHVGDLSMIRYVLIQLLWYPQVQS